MTDNDVNKWIKNLNETFYIKKKPSGITQLPVSIPDDVFVSLGELTSSSFVSFELIIGIYEKQDNFYMLFQKALHYRCFIIYW